jgi:DNA primase large subunit
MNPIPDPVRLRDSNHKALVDDLYVVHMNAAANLPACIRRMMQRRKADERLYAMRRTSTAFLAEF